ncbi:squalene synthetase-like protein [Emydomyces testavorans]|uniref:Protein SQS1 n=1 Tax=Emydomyces testavorans TaxID=2070801 RepID=A0AAF0DKC2_9EURO|nr:squalene synthetase-like protein [Emydomyces testavorans]
MSQEALNTERHSFQRSTVQLRYRGIQFVSAGALMPEHPTEVRSLEVSATPDTGKSLSSDESATNLAPSGWDKLQSISGDNASTSQKGWDATRAIDSDEDEVLFKGRNNAKQTTLTGNEDQIDELLNVEDGVHLSSVLRETSKCKASDNASSIVSRASSISSNDIPTEELRDRQGLSFRSAYKMCAGDEDINISDAVIADYLAHMDDSSSESSLSLRADEDMAMFAESADICNDPCSQHGLDVVMDHLEEEGNSDGSGEGSFDQAPLNHLLQRQQKQVAKLLSTPTLALDLDSYGDFDIMDFERPSLKKNKKKSWQVSSFGLSDSDLEWELQVSWENDRKKKKKAKKHREALRAQGLLGGNPEQVNLKAKYSNGIDFDGARREIREFLLSQTQTLSLPPMDKKVRRLVHELANSLSLKSQSRGHGKTRFPVLTKTARTRGFDSESIEEVGVLYDRASLVRQMGKASRSRGKGLKTASYVDGDVVGASAPELGAENKGRMMLERMGWINGSTLGSGKNNGILHPLKHVVKTSKAGLG